MSQGTAVTNVKVTTRLPASNTEHTTHFPVRTELTLPASQKIVKTKTQ
jgi:hypothetical protein